MNAIPTRPSNKNHWSGAKEDTKQKQDRAQSYRNAPVTRCLYKFNQIILQNSAVTYAKIRKDHDSVKINQTTKTLLSTRKLVIKSVWSI
jgi:hypothetical protein